MGGGLIVVFTVKKSFNYRKCSKIAVGRGTIGEALEATRLRQSRRQFPRNYPTTVAQRVHRNAEWSDLWQASVHSGVTRYGGGIEFVR